MSSSPSNRQNRTTETSNRKSRHENNNHYGDDRDDGSEFNTRGHRRPKIEGMVSLKVNNITERTGVNLLNKVFSKFGVLGDIFVPRYPDTFASRGFAFVRYYRKRDAEEAMRAMNDKRLDGRILSIQMARYARPNSKSSLASKRSHYGSDFRRSGVSRSYRRGDYSDRSRRRRSRSGSRSLSRDKRKSDERHRRSRSRSKGWSKRRTRYRSKSKSRSQSRSRSRSQSRNSSQSISTEKKSEIKCENNSELENEKNVNSNNDKIINNNKSDIDSDKSHNLTNDTNEEKSSQSIPMEKKSKGSRCLQNNNSLKFSDIVNSNQSNGTTNKIKILGGVSRRVQMKKQNSDSLSTTSDFKVRDTSADDGIRSVRSLMGIRRDNQILYVPKFDSNSNYETTNRLHMKDVFSCDQMYGSGMSTASNLNLNSNIKTEKLCRAISEPDFLNNFEKLKPLKEEKTETPESSIFERQGFGSVSFRGRITSENLFSKHMSDERSGRKGSDRSSADSIGSVGSLAHRNAFGLEQNWEEEEDIDDNTSKTIPILRFLYAHGLKEYLSIFRSEKIDLEALMLLNEEDLISLGLPLGPRRKILKSIDRRKNIIDNPGNIHDSRL